MQIVHANPPNLAELRTVFPELNKPDILNGISFSWGDRIYRPGGGEIHAAIRAHEEVHGRQHKEIGGPEKWWRRYIDDMEFRLAQEIPAFRAEYQYFVETIKDRNRRAHYLSAIAQKLSSPLYGSMIPYGRAVAAIRQ